MFAFDELKSGLREKVFLAQFIGGWSSLVLLAGVMGLLCG
jgi:hypothetical protein